MWGYLAGHKQRSTNQLEIKDFDIVWLTPSSRTRLDFLAWTRQKHGFLFKAAYPRDCRRQNTSGLSLRSSIFPTPPLLSFGSAADLNVAFRRSVDFAMGNFLHFACGKKIDFPLSTSIFVSSCYAISKHDHDSLFGSSISHYPFSHQMVTHFWRATFFLDLPHP